MIYASLLLLGALLLPYPLHAASLNLSWQAPLTNEDGSTLIDLDHYKLYRCEGAGCMPTLNRSVGNVTAIIDDGLANGTIYRYVVTAVNAEGLESDASNLAEAVTESAPAQPGVLIAGYSFKEGAGLTLGDATGQHPGTLSGGPTWTSSGKYGKALNFDGNNDKVSVPDEPSLRAPSTALTVSLWVRPQSSKTWTTLVNKLHRDHYLSYAIGQGAQGSTRLSGYLQVNDTLYITPLTAAMSTNTWYYAVLTWESGQPLHLTLYRENGSLLSTVSTPQTITGTITYDSSPLVLAEDEGGENWRGRLDELRIYSRSLSAVELGADQLTPIP